MLGIVSKVFHVQQNQNILLNQVRACMHIVRIKNFNSLAEAAYEELVSLRNSGINLLNVCLFKVFKVPAVTRREWRLVTRREWRLDEPRSLKTTLFWSKVKSKRYPKYLAREQAPSQHDTG